MWLSYLEELYCFIMPVLPDVQSIISSICVIMHDCDSDINSGFHAEPSLIFHRTACCSITLFQSVSRAFTLSHFVAS